MNSHAQFFQIAILFAFLHACSHPGSSQVNTSSFEGYLSNEYAGAAADNGDAPVENEGHPSDRNVGLFPDSDDLEIIDEGDDIEIIYVQGTLSDSISRALQTKRYVIECPGITEDIGNLPDVSIADSIKRLPPRPPNE